MQLDPTFLQSEGCPPDSGHRLRRWVIWTSVAAASAGSLVYLALHITSAAGAAGGCGGA